MSLKELEVTASALVARGKGILAADDTVAALTRRLAARAIDPTPDSRRASRELFLSAPWATDIVNGVSLHEETIRQHSATGIAFPDLLARRGIVAGIRVIHAHISGPGRPAGRRRQDPTGSRIG